MSNTLTEIKSLSIRSLNLLISLLNEKKSLKFTEYGYIVNSEILDSFSFKLSDLNEILESGLTSNVKDIKNILSYSKIDSNDILNNDLVDFLNINDSESIPFIINNETIMGLIHLEYNE